MSIYRQLPEPDKFTIISREKYLQFIKEKIFEDEDLIEKAFKLVKPEPGFVVSNTSKELRPMDACALCSQLSREPLNCGSCQIQYCKSCAYFLVTLFDLKNGKRSENPVIDLIGQLFECLTLSCPLKTLFIQHKNPKDLDDYTVKCVYGDCEFTANYDIVIKHCLLHCTKKSDDFKFDEDVLGFMFTNPVDPMLEIYDCSKIEHRLQEENINISSLQKDLLDNFCEPMQESEHVNIINAPQKRSATEELNLDAKRRRFNKKARWEHLLDKFSLNRSPLYQQPQPLIPSTQPSTSSSCAIIVAEKSSTSEAQATSNREDLLTEKEVQDKIAELKKNQESFHQPRTVADKRREARHRKLDRERGLRLPSINNPQEKVNEQLKSLTSSSHSESYNFSEAISYVPASCGPTPKVAKRFYFNSEAARENFHYRKRNPQKWSKKERKRKQALNQKLLHSRVLAAAKDMLPPAHYAVQISKAAIKAKNAGLSVCAIDLENCTIQMKNGNTHQVPIWVAIIDATSRVVYHQFIRHPDSAVKDYGTQLHGLKKEEINKSKNFKTIRQEVIDVLRKYDRIIVCGQTGDFVSLFLTINDHLYLLPRIICVASYYNTYLNNDAFGLKYISYLLFNVELQKKTHSPLIDAAYTLYAYLIDFDRIEEVKRLLKNPKPISQGFHGFIYPPNHHMASLLTETMKIVKDWPDAFKVSPYDYGSKRLKKMQTQKFLASHHITPTDPAQVHYPYKMTEERKQSLLQSRLR